MSWVCQARYPPRLRQGIAEVIYGAGKTAEQIAGIVEAMKKRGQELVLITRMDPEKARHTEDLLKQKFEDGAGFRYFDGTGIGICGDFPEKDGVGHNRGRHWRDQRYPGG